MKKNFLLILASCIVNTCIAQKIFLSEANVIVEKRKDLELIIPIEVDLYREIDTDTNGYVTFLIKEIFPSDGVAKTNELNKTNCLVKNTTQYFSLFDNKLRTMKYFVKKTFYIIIDKNANISTNYNITFDVSIGNRKNQITDTIKIIPAKDIVYCLNDYIENDSLRINNVYKVEQNNNLLTIFGAKKFGTQKRFTTINIALKPGEIYSVRERIGFWNNPFSIVSIPLKFRPAPKINKVKIAEATTTAGLTNLGVNLDLVRIQSTSYFARGNKAVNKFSFGFWLAPQVEELDSELTRGFLPANVISRQFTVSSAVTLTYSINNVTFIFVPAGRDFGTSTIGKNWLYHNRYWWGFGIGVSPQLFSSIFK